jgi:uncharacterized protein YxeA
MILLIIIILCIISIYNLFTQEIDTENYHINLNDESFKKLDFQKTQRLAIQAKNLVDNDDIIDTITDFYIIDNLLDNDD